MLSHGFQKGSGRVGRSTVLSDNEKITRAVIAHVRHTETPYDSLLQKAKDHGPSERRREDARALVRAQVDDVLRAWRPESTHTPESPTAVNLNPYATSKTCLAETSINLISGNANQSENVRAKHEKSVRKLGQNSLMASTHAPNTVTTHDLLTDKSQAEVKVVQGTPGRKSLDASIHAHKSMTLRAIAVDSSVYLTTAFRSSKRQAAAMAERRFHHQQKGNRKARKLEARREREKLAEQPNRAKEEEKELEAMIEVARQNSRKMWDDPTFVDTLYADDRRAVSQLRNSSAKTIKKRFRRFLRTQMSESTSSNSDVTGEPSTVDQSCPIFKDAHLVNVPHEPHKKKDDSDDDCVMLFECPVLKPAKPMTGMKFITDLHLSRHAPVIPNPRLSRSSQVSPGVPLGLKQHNITFVSGDDKQTSSPQQAIQKSFMMMDIDDGDREPLGAQDAGNHSIVSGSELNQSGNRTAGLSCCSPDEHMVAPEIWMEID